MTAKFMNSAGKRDDRALRGICTMESGARGYHGCRKPAVASYRRVADGFVALRCKWHDSFMDALMKTGRWVRTPVPDVAAPAPSMAAEREP